MNAQYLWILKKGAAKFQTTTTIVCTPDAIVACQAPGPKDTRFGQTSYNSAREVLHHRREGYPKL